MKVFLRTYGCRANHYDSEQIGSLLTRLEHPADVVVVKGKSGVTEDLLTVIVEGTASRGSRIRGRLGNMEGQLKLLASSQKL